MAGRGHRKIPLFFQPLSTLNTSQDTWRIHQARPTSASREPDCVRSARRQTGPKDYYALGSTRASSGLSEAGSGPFRTTPRR